MLLLYSHQVSSPINADWDRGIRRAIAAGYPDGARVEAEHLDLGREEDHEYNELLLDLLRHKYADVQFDAVVPVYVQAFNFVKANRELFQNAPIVFCSVPVGIADPTQELVNATGVVFTLDFVETVKSARKMFPNAQRLVVLSGTSREDQNLRQWAELSLSGVEKEMQLEYVTGAPLSVLCQKLAELDARSIVLVLSYDRDVEGRNQMTVEALQAIAKYSRAPVFGLYDTLLGHGILGGKMASAEAQGELAGQMVVRVLRGEAPTAIAPRGLETNQYMFDARQMRRWSISTDDLPAKSQLRYSEPTLWDRYGVYLVGIAGTVILQTLVITALVINRSRRMRAEESLLASRGRAQELAGKLLSAQEDERRRLARELHDDLTQRLAAAAIAAGKLEHQAASSNASPESLKQLKHLKQDLINISQDVHRVSRQIHPAILDDLGLADALRSECDRLSKSKQIQVKVRCGELPEKIPMNTAVCLYRIAQESLWNAVKHSQADQVELTLSADEETIHLEVRDSGVGFGTLESDGKFGLGLESMRERIRLVNGRLEIKTAPGQGTVVAVDVPIPESA
ncbi:MAG: histidine kinase [bacterium]|nr:histidine kinase [bacterium]